MPKDKEWEEKTVIINRGKFGDIVAMRIVEISRLAKIAGDENLADFVEELLARFAAAVATDVFDKDDELEVE